MSSGCKNPHNEEMQAPNVRPAAVCPNKIMPILNKIPCIVIASIGVSFFPAGERLFRALAIKEIEPGSKSEPFLPALDEARESKKIWFNESKCPANGRLNECKTLPKPTSEIESKEAYVPQISMTEFCLDVLSNCRFIRVPHQIESQKNHFNNFNYLFNKYFSLRLLSWP